MIAYKKELLEKSRINDIAEIWNKKGLISKESLVKIGVSYKTNLYTPHFFIRLALFVFTVILASAGFGLITLITISGSNETSIGIRLIAYGFLSFGILEVLIHNKKLYKAGIDDALLYIALSFLISGICIISTIRTYDNNEYSNNNEIDQILIFMLCAFPILLAATIRYTDMLIAALTYLCLFAIMFLVLNQAGKIAQMLLPFAGILFSGIAYFLINKYKTKDSLIFWKDAMTVIEILSLFTFYFSGNYLVVRELSQEMFNKKLAVGEDIHLAIIFYLFTALVPFCFIFKALQSKDRIMLRVGLMIFAMGILTFKYYYSLGHHEISLTLAGITMIAVSVFIMKYLKTPRHGLTTKEDLQGNSILNTDMETIIIAESFKNSGQEKGVDFGGGKFGGGGAGSGF